MAMKKAPKKNSKRKTSTKVKAARPAVRHAAATAKYEQPGAPWWKRVPPPPPKQ